MSSLIENPAKYEVRAVLPFLHATKLSTAKRHRQITDMYGENVMSDSIVRQWCHEFSDFRTNIHDEDRSGRPSLVTDELEQRLDDNIRLNVITISDNFS